MDVTDAPKAVLAIIQAANIGKAVLELQVGWDAGPLPVHLVYQAGGTPGVNHDHVATIRVDTYASGLTATSKAAADVYRTLVTDPVWTSTHSTPYGLLDDVMQGPEPVNVPYTSDRIKCISATYMVEFRTP